MIDQEILWNLGVVPKLRQLVHSKHASIAQDSSEALRNLSKRNNGSSNNNTALAGGGYSDHMVDDVISKTEQVL